MKKYTKKEIQKNTKPIIKEIRKFILGFIASIMLTILCFVTGRMIAFYGCLAFLFIMCCFSYGDIKRALLVLSDIKHEKVSSLEGILIKKEEIKVKDKDPIYHISLDTNKKLKFISCFELKECNTSDLVRVFYTQSSKVIMDYEVITGYKKAHSN